MPWKYPSLHVVHKNLVECPTSVTLTQLPIDAWVSSSMLKNVLLLIGSSLLMLIYNYCAWDSIFGFTTTIKWPYGNCSWTHICSKLKPKKQKEKKIGLGPIFAYYWREGDKGAGARTYCNWPSFIKNMFWD